MRTHLTPRNFILLLSCGVMLYSLFMIGSYITDMYSSKQQTNEARELYKKPLSAAPPSAPSQPVEQSLEEQPSTELSTISIPTNSQVPKKVEIQEAFLPLLEKNEDTVGWLNIEGTPIDYPVVQVEDNDYYLYRGIDKNDNKAGTIFMDYRNQVAQDNNNIVLYGHNMNNDSMFAFLLHYESRWNFENLKKINLDTIYEPSEWVIFSAYFTDIHHDYTQTNFNNDEDFKAYIDDIRGRSLHKSDVEITADDTILTLSTCSYHLPGGEQRFAVHAVKVAS